MENGKVAIVHYRTRAIKKEKERSEARSIPEHVRKYIHEKYNYTCVFCGKDEGRMEIDHIIPFSKGGGNGICNLQTACPKCNVMKGNMDNDTFISLLAIKQTLKSFRNKFEE